MMYESERQGRISCMASLAKADPERISSAITGQMDNLFGFLAYHPAQSTLFSR